MPDAQGAALAVHTGARWPMAAPPRHLSYGVDIVLLAAGLLPFTILPGAMVANGWLTVKLALLAHASRNSWTGLTQVMAVRSLRGEHAGMNVPCSPSMQTAHE